MSAPDAGHCGVVTGDQFSEPHQGLIVAAPGIPHDETAPIAIQHVGDLRDRHLTGERQREHRVDEQG